MAFDGGPATSPFLPLGARLASLIFSAICEGIFVRFARFPVPRHVCESVDDVEGKLRFRHVPATFILVRQDQLNQTNAVWIADPPLNLPAQPVKPETWGLVKRFLAHERQRQLPIVMPEAPDRSQKVVSMLKCSVIETINPAPFSVIGIGQNNSGKLRVQVAPRNNDP